MGQGLHWPHQTLLSSREDYWCRRAGCARGTIFYCTTAIGPALLGGTLGCNGGPGVRPLALALLVTGGKLVVNQFEGPFPALGLSLKKVQFHLRQLGCAMAKSKAAAGAEKGETIATLKLPLAFPKESRGAPAARR